MLVQPVNNTHGYTNEQKQRMDKDRRGGREGSSIIWALHRADAKQVDSSSQRSMLSLFDFVSYGAKSHFVCLNKAWNLKMCKITNE